MASSSGTSSVSTLLQNSGSEEDLQLVMDERKRKRMLSNRESARRSRLRKQEHLDDLMTRVGQLRKENDQIIASLNLTTQHFLNVEVENSVLRTQMIELSNRLQSLNEILECMNGANVFETEIHQNIDMNPWNLIHLNQPIIASAEIFQY
ncbi:bZIP transcription factor 44-like [Tasmannia lanceolata]|uniref:bZIP transcription factor 44-like n=1 Tax=Tasmannia lanceolata TaxID=3420 RepID=UPI004064C89E